MGRGVAWYTPCGYGSPVMGQLGGARRGKRMTAAAAEESAATVTASVTMAVAMAVSWVAATAAVRGGAAADANDDSGAGVGVGLAWWRSAQLGRFPRRHANVHRPGGSNGGERTGILKRCELPPAEARVLCAMCAIEGASLRSSWRRQHRKVFGHS